MLVHEQLIQRGYDFAIAVFTWLLHARGLPVGDVAALAAIALGSLLHFRGDEALYGKKPAGATEEQFVATWVDTGSGPSGAARHMLALAMATNAAGQTLR